MRILYVRHSGFAVEIGDAALVFDFWKGELPGEIWGKDVVVFVSHGHEDHFNPEIFSWAREGRRVRFVISRDVWRKARKALPVEEGLVQVMRAGEEWRTRTREGELAVRALPSTDAGVAYLAGLGDGEEKTWLFHAGDLNRWTWPEDTKQHRNQMIAEYQRAIDTLADVPVGAAFLPLDPRIGEEYGESVRYYLRKVRSGYVFPMHMWEQYEAIDRFREGLPVEERERIVRIAGAPQMFSIEGGKLRYE